MNYGKFLFADVLVSCESYDPSKQREGLGLVAFHFRSALPNALYGVRWLVGSLAALATFG